MGSIHASDMVVEGSVNGIVVFNDKDSWKSFVTLIEYLEPEGREQSANGTHS